MYPFVDIKALAFFKDCWAGGVVPGGNRTMSEICGSCCSTVWTPDPRDARKYGLIRDVIIIPEWQDIN